MQYWRMQLHPNEPDLAVKHSVHALAAGVIGLGFRGGGVGDLRTTEYESLPEGQRDYWAFGHTMEIGDKVLVFCHHFPFALATVDSEYKYVPNAQLENGVWFRHLRRVKDVRFYADHITNARSWEQLRMTKTISPLHDPNSKSYQLIDQW